MDIVTAITTNAIDFIAAVVVAFSTLLGLVRGLFRCLWGVAAWVCGIAVAAEFYELLIPYFTQDGQGESLLAAPLAVVSLFLAVYLGFKLVGLLLRGAVGALDLAGFDYLGGAVFGVVRGGLVVLLVVLLASMVGLQKRAVWQESLAVPLVGRGLQVASSPFGGTGGWVVYDASDRPYMVRPRGDGKVIAPPIAPPRLTEAPAWLRALVAWASSFGNGRDDGEDGRDVQSDAPASAQPALSEQARAALERNLERIAEQEALTNTLNSQSLHYGGDAVEHDDDDQQPAGAAGSGEEATMEENLQMHKQAVEFQNALIDDLNAQALQPQQQENSEQ